MKSKLLSQSINVDENDNDNDFAHKISLITQFLLLEDNSCQSNDSVLVVISLIMTGSPGQTGSLCETRLTYDCAHLRSSKESLTIF